MKQKLKVKENIILGCGKTQIAVRKSESEDFCILLTDIEPSKIGVSLESSLDTEKEYTVLTFKNIQGLKVLEEAIKAVKKEIKNNNKKIGL